MRSYNCGQIIILVRQQVVRVPIKLTYPPFLAATKYLLTQTAVSSYFEVMKLLRTISGRLIILSKRIFFVIIVILYVGGRCVIFIYTENHK